MSGRTSPFLLCVCSGLPEENPDSAYIELFYASVFTVKMVVVNVSAKLGHSDDCVSLYMSSIGNGTSTDSASVC